MPKCMDLTRTVHFMQIHTRILQFILWVNFFFYKLPKSANFSVLTSEIFRMGALLSGS